MSLGTAHYLCQRARVGKNKEIKEISGFSFEMGWGGGRSRDILCTVVVFV